jgi:hypothetical protein
VDYLVIEGAKPYDGRYEFSLDVLTAREWGWIKRFAHYLPEDLSEKNWSDPELVCALAVIMLCRAEKVDKREVPDVFERLIDAPFETLIRLEMSELEEPEDDDAGPPSRSSDESTPSSGDNGRTSSETLPPIPSPSGMPDSATSASLPGPRSET